MTIIKPFYHKLEQLGVVFREIHQALRSALSSKSEVKAALNTVETKRTASWFGNIVLDSPTIGVAVGISSQLGLVGISYDRFRDEVVIYLRFFHRCNRLGRSGECYGRNSRIARATGWSEAQAYNLSKVLCECVEQLQHKLALKCHHRKYSS